MKKRMIRYKLFLLPVFLMLATASCGPSENEKKFSKMEWLIGHWDGTISPKTIEKWSALNPTHYKAQTYMMENRDTIFSEEIDLKIEDDDVYYIPSFEGQSGDMATRFKLVKQKDNEVTFENKEHDYPQRIIYRLVSPDSLHARLEGKQDGQKKDFNFYYVRRR